MSTPLHGQISGTYVSDGLARVLQLRFEPDYFELFNQTNFNSAPATPVTKRAWWFRSLDPDSAFTVKNTISLDTDESDFVSVSGIRLINTITDPVEAAVAGSTITAAATPVVTTTAPHGYVVGDVVRLYSTTGMLQIAGMEFTVTAVPSTITFEIDFLNASTFVAATANVSRRLPFDPPDFAPKIRFVTNITNAVNAVVTLSVAHGYSVGEIISLRCTPAFGMSEINGEQGQILSIDTTLNTVTVDINSTAFTAFAFPTSAIAGGGITFPQTVPVGDFDTLSGATDNQAFIGLRLGTDVVGATDDIVHWVATKGLFGIA